MHVNSIMLFTEHAVPFIPAGSRVLEIGADRSPSSYRKQVLAADLTWETADLRSEVGIWGTTECTFPMPDAYSIPVEDNTFDVVLSGQVLEHVQQVWTWMAELARVTRPGGVVITLSPVSWPYHEAPVDCWRVYPEGMQALAGFAGLEVEHCWWGTVEPAPTTRTYPGTGTIVAMDPVGRKALAVTLIKRLLNWPAPVAFDMVTVARKPSQPQPPR